jgi:hypothetical protein
MTTIYIVLLDYWYDDYKRAEGSSSVVGVFTDKNKAYRIGLKEEAENNLIYHNDRLPEKDSDESDKDPDNESEESDETDEEPATAYKKKTKELDTCEVFDDAFMETWEEIREDYLGEPEYTMNSSGYRFQIQEAKLDEVIEYE